MAKRRKRRSVIHVSKMDNTWLVEIEYPFKVRGEPLITHVAEYKRFLPASNLADRLEGELQGAEVVIHD